MIIKLFSLIIGAFFFVQCNRPLIETTMTEDKSDNSKDSCCTGNNTNTEITIQSEITCPKCGHKKKEIMPTDVCVIKYNCEKCQTEMRPQDGDCCVYCTYGIHKCPSMQ